MIDAIRYGRTGDVTHEWKRIEFEKISLPSGYDLPIPLAAMQSFNGPNTAAVRMRSLRPQSFEVKIEEERSADRETWHTGETVGHIAFSPLWITDAEGSRIGYANSLDLAQPEDGVWMALPVPASFSVDEAVVFVQVLTFNGAQPVHARVAKAHPETGRPGFFVKLEEWPRYDKYHVGERLGVVALKKGYHALRYAENPHLMVGEIDDVEEGWRPVDLRNTVGSGPPALVTQCQTFNGSHPVVTRQREPEPFKAEVRLQEAESQGRHPNAEKVGYVAMGIPFY